MSEVRPRRKASFPSYVIDDTIYVQGCGELIEIEDAGGDVRRLLDLLDGTRTVDEVAGQLASEGNGLSREDVLEAIAELDRRSLLEDAAKDRLDDAYAVERWSRNLGFFETYATLGTGKHELQQRLGPQSRAGLEHLCDARSQRFDLRKGCGHRRAIERQAEPALDVAEHDLDECLLLALECLDENERLQSRAGVRVVALQERQIEAR